MWSYSSSKGHSDVSKRAGWGAFFSLSLETSLRILPCLLHPSCLGNDRSGRKVLVRDPPFSLGACCASVTGPVRPQVGGPTSHTATASDICREAW